MKHTMLLILASFLTGCMSTKFVLDANWNYRTKPTYEDYFDTWWWGISGNPEVSLQKVCMDQKPLAFQRVKSPEDIIISTATLGIYAPTTVKIWCGE
jgi:hypothetical protein